MKPGDWAELLKKIPAEDHERMVFATHLGVEVAVHRVLCIEQEYCLVRGRVGGTADAFRLFCLPYDQLVYFGFSRPVPDEHLAAVFGPLLRPTEEAKKIQPEPEGEEAPAAEPPPAEKPTDSKITILEKLRARAAEKDVGKRK